MMFESEARLDKNISIFFFECPKVVQVPEPLFPPIPSQRFGSKSLSLGEVTPFSMTTGWALQLTRFFPSDTNPTEVSTGSSV